jgi:hypothetical protein
MKSILFFFILFLSAHAIWAQAPDIQWQRNFGGDETENFTGLGESPDGYYYFAGTSTSPASGDRTQARRGSYDFWIVKTDVNGNIIWNKAVGGGGATRMNSMTVTADGGIILAGNTDAGVNFEKTEPNRGPLGTVDIWVIKLDANGNKVWDKTLGGTGNEAPFAITETPDGGCIIAGESTSPASGDKTAPMIGFSKDCWVVRLDQFGVKLWDKAYGGTESEAFYAVTNTSDGGFLFGGLSSSGVSGNKSEPSRGGNDCWLVKTDANGNIQWDKTYGGDKTDLVSSINEIQNEEFIIGAFSESEISGDKTVNSKGSADAWLLKLNAMGNIIWQKGIGGNGYDAIRNIELTKDGGFFILFNSESGISGDKTVPDFGGIFHFWIVKTNAEGNIQWQNSYGDVSNDNPYDAVVTSDNGFLLGGFSNKWRKGDYWIIKLKPETSTFTLNSYSNRVSVYPNPSNGILNFKLSSKKSGLADVEIISADGKTIQINSISVVDGYIKLNQEWQNGSYFFRISFLSEIYLGRFVILK